MNLELETWEPQWKKTRKRGQPSFVLIRGAAYSGLWFLFNIILYGFGKDKMSYLAVVLMSLFFLS